LFFVQTDNSDELNLRSVYRRAPHFSAPFHWLEAGWEHDETVVLIHGIMAHSMAFRKVVGRLAERYRVVIPDLPAHGRDQTFRCQTLAPQVEGFFPWMDGLIEAVGAPSIHLVGHSLGALATFMAAKRPPENARIESLTLVSPGVRIDVPRWTARFFDLLPLSLARLSVNRLGLRMYEPIQWRKTRMTSAEMRSYLKPLKERERLEFIIDLGVDLVREPDRIDGASDIDVPTLILWGDRDHLLSLETGRVLQSMIVGSDFRVLDGVGHCPMEDDPGRFLDHVLDFYQSA
jgi:pimeloyl-ACP methyl ester carboxylesterase